MHAGHGPDPCFYFMGAVEARPLRRIMGTDFEPVTVPTQSISIIQVNLNKAHAAHIELLNKINTLETYIALVTEPYCYKKKLCILPKGSNCLPQIKSGSSASLYNVK